MISGWFDSRRGKRFFLFSKTSRLAVRFVPRMKWPGREVDYSLLSSAEIKNGWSYTSVSPICPNTVHGINFTLTLVAYRSKCLGGYGRDNLNMAAMYWPSY